MKTKKLMVRKPSDIYFHITENRIPNKDAKERLKRILYKSTDCGAWIEFGKTSVTIGSIVEGVDWNTETRTLTYPFVMDEYWSAVQAVEDEAKDIWNQTHGCEDCGPEGDNGYIAINPECKTCHGEGDII
jgi:hypothetical protein